MNLPIGSIILWYQGEIPADWRLCDGLNGTPDLRGYFIKGATNAEDLLTEGGVSDHVHTTPETEESPAHTHSVSRTSLKTSKRSSTVGDTSNTNLSYGDHTHTYSGTTSSGGDHSHTASDANSASNLPPFIRLYYIMKVT